VNEIHSPATSFTEKKAWAGCWIDPRVRLDAMIYSYRKRMEARCQVHGYALTEFAMSTGYTAKEFRCERQNSTVGMVTKPQAVRFRVRIPTGA
jgi:hypothetical protein